MKNTLTVARLDGLIEIGMASPITAANEMTNEEFVAVLSLAKAELESRWRDISEAPKDGSAIEGYREMLDGSEHIWFCRWATKEEFAQREICPADPDDFTDSWVMVEEPDTLVYPSHFRVTTPPERGQ